MKLLTIKQVIDLTGFSRAHIYNLIAAGKFPRQIKSGKSSRWIDSEIQNCIQKQMDARDGLVMNSTADAKKQDEEKLEAMRRKLTVAELRAQSTLTLKIDGGVQS